jgi:hypothetical protein
MNYRSYHRKAIVEAPENEQQAVGCGSLDLRKDMRKMGENQEAHWLEERNSYHHRHKVLLEVEDVEYHCLVQDNVALDSLDSADHGHQDTTSPAT